MSGTDVENVQRMYKNVQSTINYYSNRIVIIFRYESRVDKTVSHN